MPSRAPACGPMICAPVFCTAANISRSSSGSKSDLVAPALTCAADRVDGSMSSSFDAGDVQYNFHDDNLLVSRRRYRTCAFLRSGGEELIQRLGELFDAAAHRFTDRVLHR